MGKRIRNLVVTETGVPVEADKRYVVGGWASVNPDTEGPAIYDLLESYITRKELIQPAGVGRVNVIGM